MRDKSLLKEIIQIRRQIHRYPELGDNEFKTAGLIEKVLKSLRIPHRRLTRTGIVATLKGGSPGPCVALRADMDALPLTETSRKPYASRIPGVMHACGHDAHVAMLLGAAKLLSKNRDFNGTVKFFFQPNEEGAGGAKSLIAKGAMRQPPVEAVFGLHVNPRVRAGAVAVKEGPLMAAVDRFEIEIQGEGGHAAYPHEGRDAIAMASELVLALQTIVSRKIDPLEPVVLTVGTLEAGTRYNILAGKARMSGTVRTLSEKVHAQIPGFIRRLAGGITQAHGGTFRLAYETIGSVLRNDAAMAALARSVAGGIVGKANVFDMDKASMGGEDFSEYLKSAPGCFIYIGTGKIGSKMVPWHHSAFDIEEKALLTGAKLLCGIAREFLSRHAS